MCSQSSKGLTLPSLDFGALSAAEMACEILDQTLPRAIVKDLAPQCTRLLKVKLINLTIKDEASDRIAKNDLRIKLTRDLAWQSLGTAHAGASRRGALSR